VNVRGHTREAGGEPLQVRPLRAPSTALLRRRRLVVPRQCRADALEEPTDQLNVRASIADINRFVEWCERKRYSYREGFGLLVAKIED